MTRNRETGELVEALAQVLALCEHLTAPGQGAYLAEDLDAGLRRLAGERLVITLQAVLDDLPASFVEDNPDLPFDLVPGMRHRLAHGYDDIDDIDDRIVWNTLSGSLPVVIREFARRLAAGG